MNALATELECTFNEYSTFWYVPVTLAETHETFEIELDSTFGIDAEEYQSLAHDTGILRLKFGVYCDDEMECADQIDLECYELHSPDTEPAWHSVSKRYHHVSGVRERHQYNRNERRMWQMLERHLPSYQSMLDREREGFEFTIDKLYQP
jgi:hypothetical protein